MTEFLAQVVVTSLAYFKVLGIALFFFLFQVCCKDLWFLETGISFRFLALQGGISITSFRERNLLNGISRSNDLKLAIDLLLSLFIVKMT